MSMSTFFMPKTNPGGEEVLKYVSNEIKFTLNRKLYFSAIMTLFLITIYNEYSYSFEKLEALCDNKDTEMKGNISWLFVNTSGGLCTLSVN